MTTADGQGSEGDVLLGNAAPAATTPAAAAPATGDAAKADTTVDVLLTDGNSADAKAKPDGDAAKDDAKATADKRAPEAYEWPEVDGYAFDKDAAEAFAREHDLTQEQAAALLQREAGTVKAAIDAKQAAEVDAWNKQVADWKATAKQEFGAEYDATRIAGNRALTKYADQELIDALKAGGWQNFPPLIRLLAKVGKDLGEGQSLGASAAAGPRPFHERLFAKS